MHFKQAARLCGALIIAAALAVIWKYSVTGVKVPADQHSSSLPGSAPATAPATGTRVSTGHTLAGRPTPHASSAAPGGDLTSRDVTPVGVFSTGTSAVPTTAGLKAALLTSAQLPDGPYTLAPIASEIGTESLGTCPALSAGGAGVTGQASVFYTAGLDGPYIEEALLQDSVSGAEEMVSAVTEAALSCSAIPVSVNGLNLIITLQAEPFPAIGNQAAAVAVDVSAAGSPTTIHVADIAAVRYGGTVIEVTNAGYPLYEALTTEVTAEAYDKVVTDGM